MKIKCQPTDFIVNEITDIPLDEKGSYSVFLLKKENWNTFDVIRQLAKAWNIPIGKLSYGGKKDRHALTSQYIAVQGRNLKALIGQGYSLEFKGNIERPMGPDLISGNYFEIVVRCLSDDAAEQALKNCGIVKEFGLPNYFDDQRFGGFDPLEGFFAEKLLKGHLNGALKAYLCSISPDDKKDERDRKLYFREHWKEWDGCFANASTVVGKRIFEQLKKDATNFFKALQIIPKEDLSLMYSAYQSFIWNEMIRRYLKSLSGNMSIYEGKVADYVFPIALNRDEVDTLSGLNLPLAAAKVEILDSSFQKLYSDILAEQGLTSVHFKKIKLRQAYFKASDRKVWIYPDDFCWESGDDELYRRRKKLVLKFRLGRGSYATMLIKKIFAK